MDFLITSFIPSIGKTFLHGATCPTERLFKEYLIVFYLVDFKTVFYAFFDLDQVSK